MPPRSELESHFANWRRAMPVIREAKAERVILAFDRDEREETCKAVDRNLAEFREALRVMQVRVLIASWKEGKGIDDALALGKAIRSPEGTRGGQA